MRYLLFLMILLFAENKLSAAINLADFRDVIGDKMGKIVFSDSFESISKNSLKLAPGATVGRDGVNGSGSLTIESKTFHAPNDNEVSLFLTQFETGKKYRVRINACFKNLNPGPTEKKFFFIISFYEDGKYIGNRPLELENVKKGDRPWQVYEYLFEPPASKNRNISAKIKFFMNNIAGKVIIDNLLIEEIGESLPLVHYNYPGNLNISGTSPLHFWVENFGRGNNLLLHVVSGKITGTGKIINKKAMIKLPDLPEGKNILKCYVLDPAKKIRYGEVCCTVFNIPQNANGIKLRLDGGLERNGKPFLPVGIFASYQKLTPVSVKQIADGGFNFVQPYLTPDLNIQGKGGLTQLQALRNSMDYLSQNNLMLSCCLKELIRKNTMAIDGRKGIEAVPYIVNGIKDHPALMSYYISDENPLGEIPWLINCRELISENDPNHPVFTLTYVPDHATHFGPTGDIFIADIYPIYDEKSQSMSRVRSFITKVNQKTSFRCCWLTPQTFHWGAFKTKTPYSEYRYPTEQEMRSMVLLAMNLGTKGYLFYSHTPILDRKSVV